MSRLKAILNYCFSISLPEGFWPAYKLQKKFVWYLHRTKDNFYFSSMDKNGSRKVWNSFALLYKSCEDVTMWNVFLGLRLVNVPWKFTFAMDTRTTVRKWPGCSANSLEKTDEDWGWWGTHVDGFFLVERSDYSSTSDRYLTPFHHYVNNKYANTVIHLFCTFLN